MYFISHKKISPVKNSCCYDKKINCTFLGGVYILKRTLQGCLKINFSSHAEKYLNCLLRSLNIFQHLKRNFIALCCHVIFSIYRVAKLICCYFCAKKSNSFHVQKLDRCLGFIVSRMPG